MNKKEKYEIMDLLLLEFNESKQASEISKKINVDFHIIHSLSMILLDKGYLTSYRELAYKGVEYKQDFIANISQKGLYFLNVDGGFKSKYKQYILNKSWTIAKTIAAIANALIIICISIWAIIESKKDSKLENRIIDLENKIFVKPTDQTIDKTLKNDSIINNIKID